MPISFKDSAAYLIEAYRICFFAISRHGQASQTRIEVHVIFFKEVPQGNVFTPSEQIPNTNFPVYFLL